MVSLIVGILVGLVACACLDYKHHILIDLCICFFLITMYFVDFVDFTRVSLGIVIFFTIISLAIEITWYVIYTRNWHNNVYIDGATLIGLRRYEKYISWILMGLKGLLLILLIIGIFFVGKTRTKSYNTGPNSQVTIPLY